MNPSSAKNMNPIDLDEFDVVDQPSANKVAHRSSKKRTPTKKTSTKNTAAKLGKQKKRNVVQEAPPVNEPDESPDDEVAAPPIANGIAKEKEEEEETTVDAPQETKKKRQRRVITAESIQDEIEDIIEKMNDIRMQKKKGDVPRMTQRLNHLRALLKQVQKDVHRLPAHSRQRKKQTTDPSAPPRTTSLMIPKRLQPATTKFLSKHGLWPSKEARSTAMLSRVQLGKCLIQYIQTKGLQNPENKRKYTLDTPLAALFGETAGEESTLAQVHRHMNALFV